MKCSGLSWFKVKKEVLCDIKLRTEEEEVCKLSPWMDIDDDGQGGSYEEYVEG